MVVDQELSLKLQSELQVEKEEGIDPKMPGEIRDFLKESSFEVGYVAREMG